MLYRCLELPKRKNAMVTRPDRKGEHQEDSTTHQDKGEPSYNQTLTSGRKQKKCDKSKRNIIIARKQGI
ncbi:unnamed protein product [Pleuronectes platessa]|uniref:Uncharacterized protein n=1 Tax=Pleuronectes platessa TaxID=8262 RepID=A0A9N7Y530_PLEPL|nr:unnamed protein product [Pleuronectes platessa]